MSVLKRLNSGTDKAEMNFVDHLEALRWHVVRSVIALIISTIFCFINIQFIFNHIILGPTRQHFPTYKWLCSLSKLLHTKALCLETVKLKFQATELSTQFMMSISSSVVFGFILACPYIFWELWRFVKPALNSFELKQSRGVVLWVTLLFLFGVGFGYYILSPFTINFFATYQLSPDFENIFKIDDYLSNIISLIIGCGIVFQLPVVVFFLSKIGILTPSFMKNVRRYAIVIILVVAAVITPPDVFSMVLVSIPLIFLYEVSIGISGRIEAKRKAKEKEFFNS
jgi:sec-independent protein translocase protein TatC